MARDAKPANAMRRFPKIETKTLNRKRLVFPEGVSGKKCIVTLVFEHHGTYMKQQNEANGWLEFWKERLMQQGVTYYEIPLMSGSYIVMSPMIDGFMRSGIPEGFHGNVACFYGNKMRPAKELGITNLATAHIFLLDENGNILASASGRFDETKAATFVDVLRP